MDSMMGVGAAANVVGGIMQGIAASQARRAMDRALKKELMLQRGFQSDAWNAFQSHLPTLGAEQAQTDMGQGFDTRKNLYDSVGAIPIDTGHNPFAPTARDKAYGDMVGSQRAKLASYGEWMNTERARTTRTQDELNRISNFAQGWQQVYPYQLNDAAHSQDELAFWGQLISSIGGGAANYASLFGTQNGGSGLQPQNIDPSLAAGTDVPANP